MSGARSFGIALLIAGALGAGACGINQTLLRDLPGSIPSDGGRRPEGSFPLAEGGAGVKFGVYAGQYFTCSLANGLGYCWGSNVLGALGTGDLASHLIPTSVVGGVVFEALAAGESHTCGLEVRSGRLFCWGSSAKGQLGLGDTTAHPDLQLVPLPVAAAQVSVGYNHSCAVLTDGSLWCWGDNFEGQLGQADPADSADSPRPLRVGTESDWVSVSGGQGHTCGLRRPGTLWCWGRNTRSELGLGLGSGQPPQLRTPTRVGTFEDWSQLDLGQNSGCALRSDGSLWCWGVLSELPQQDAPTRVGTDNDWRAVSTDTFSACGIKAGNQLHCWGRNAEGQLGLGDTTPRNAPTRTGIGSSWATVAVGVFTCARRPRAMSFGVRARARTASSDSAIPHGEPNFLM